MSLLDKLKSIFAGTKESDAPSLLVDRHGNLINKELAAAFTALLVDIALSDEMLQENEVTEIIHFLQDEVALPESRAEEVMSFALDHHNDTAARMHKLGPMVLSLSDEQREHLLHLALRVAEADETVSRDEEIVVARIAELLRLTPDQVTKVRRGK